MTVRPCGDAQELNHGMSRRGNMALHAVSMTAWMLLCKSDARGGRDYGRSTVLQTRQPQHK